MKFEHLLIEDPNTLQTYTDQYRNGKPVMGDTESTGLALSATMLGFSFYQQAPDILPAFVALKTPFFQGRGIEPAVAREILNPWIKKHQFVLHNAKYDEGVFEQNGFAEPDVIADSIALIHCSDVTLEKNLEKRVQLDFNYSKKKFKEITGFDWSKITWDRDTWKLFTLEQLAEYAAEDVFWLQPIYEKYKAQCEKLGVMHIHDRIELPMTYVLKDMKRAGVTIDTEYLSGTLDKECVKGLHEAAEKVYAEAGVRFNLRSPQQKAQVLFDRLGYKSKFKTERGGRSTDKVALEELAGMQKCKVAEYMLEYSELATLYSSFIHKIPMLVDGDGRLRCDFNSGGTDTGRFSSANPNLQNQPNNKRYPVRAAFKPAKGCKLLVLDWSQIELRVVAHLSKDPLLMAAFREGRDIHQEVADRLGITRKEAKVINFAMLYGLAAPSLAAKLKISEEAAQRMLDDYAETYAGVTAWKEGVQEKAKKDGFVKNMFGRLRVLPKLQSAKRGEFYSALRQAVNTKVQGASADLMKIAMIKIHRHIKENKIPAQILLTVHDELVIEAKNSVAVDLFHKVKHIMENLTEMRVPIIAEGKICDNWAQMKDDEYLGYPLDTPIPDEADCYFDNFEDKLILSKTANQSIYTKAAGKVCNKPALSLLDIVLLNNLN